MTPEWSDFKVLLALARAGSVAGAARELQVDSSTISRRLAALEEAVGAKLLIRGGREFTWTAEGRALIDAGATMEAAATHALRAVRTARAEVSGTVRVSVAPGFIPVLVRSVLPALREAHPSLRIELDGGFQRADLARGDADIALRMARPDEPGLVACHVLDCGWCAYAAVSYLEARGRPATFDELAQHELVLYSEALHRVPPLRWMEAYRGTARDLLRVDNLEIACQTIAAGGGIAVLPCFIADGVPELRRVFSDCVAVNPGWVVYHEAARDTARVRVVAEALKDFFRSQQAMFSGGSSISAGLGSAA
ncbi:MAG TPA: LysR family transcriptional regulator [Caldimonas sp.]